GMVGVWQANAGGSFASVATSFTAVGTDWHVVPRSSPRPALPVANDFNGDGLSDILWRNDNGDLAQWLGTSAGSFASNSASYASVGTDWHVAATGDFNGDGRSVLLWRKDNGMVGVWQANANGSFASVAASF